VPGEIEVVQDRLGNAFEAKSRKDAVEIAAMQNVEAREGNAAGADFFHAGLILSAPGIGESEPIESEAERRETRLNLRCDAAAPVDQRAENVEEKGFYFGCARQEGPRLMAFWRLFMIRTFAADLLEVGPVLPMFPLKTH